MAYVKFHAPCTIILSGCTSSGKTSFVKRMLNDLDVFSVKPCKVFYFYGAYQDCFSSMSNVTFISGLPDSFDEYFEPNEHRLAILDDLQYEVASSKAVESLFTRDSHHKNFSVCLLNQNLFYQGKFCRTIALNAHVVVLFKNPRSNSQIKTLESQTGIKMINAYNDTQQEPFGYLVVDIGPFSDSAYRLRSHIFSGEYPIVYK